MKLYNTLSIIQYNDKINNNTCGIGACGKIGNSFPVKYNKKVGG
jgi:hypothetical protein